MSSCSATLCGPTRNQFRIRVAGTDPHPAFPHLVGSSATGNEPSPIVCTSLRNAADTATAKSLVRITHPFHPYGGRQLPCVGERFNRYGKRLLLQVSEDLVCSVPESWTDLVDPDPEIIAGGGRTAFLFSDLLELAHDVERLRDKEARKEIDDA